MSEPRRKQAPLKVTAVGSPITGDLRALAALLVKLDQRPPIKLVKPAPELPKEAPPHGSLSGD